MNTLIGIADKQKLSAVQWRQIKRKDSWLSKEYVLTQFDYCSAEQWRREPDIDGICGDLRRIDPEVLPPNLCHYFALLCF